MGSLTKRVRIARYGSLLHCECMVTEGSFNVVDAVPALTRSTVLGACRLRNSLCCPGCLRKHGSLILQRCVRFIGYGIVKKPPPMFRTAGQMPAYFLGRLPSFTALTLAGVFGSACSAALRRALDFTLVGLTSSTGMSLALGAS